MTRVNLMTKRRLGDLEQRLLSYVQFRGMTVVHFGELRSTLELTAEQERKVLSRLARGGTIVRLKRGVYLVPPRLPLRLLSARLLPLRLPPARFLPARFLPR